MSQENVAVVRARYDAWNAGDMDAFRELYHPDVITRTPEGWPEPGPYVGRQEAMRQFEQLRATWDASALEPISDFIDAGDRVVVRVAYHGKGHGTLYREFFWDHAEALEAVGLSEHDVHADS